MSVCRYCGVDLIPNENWYPSFAQRYIYQCMVCAKEKQKERYHSDERYREEVLRRSRRYAQEHREERRAAPISICSILKRHADDLLDDPDRLSTDFIVGLLREKE